MEQFKALLAAEIDGERCLLFFEDGSSDLVERR